MLLCTIIGLHNLTERMEDTYKSALTGSRVRYLDGPITMHMLAPKRQAKAGRCTPTPCQPHHPPRMSTRTSLLSQGCPSKLQPGKERLRESDYAPSDMPAG